MKTTSRPKSTKSGRKKPRDDDDDDDDDDYDDKQNQRHHRVKRYLQQGSNWLPLFSKIEKVRYSSVSVFPYCSHLFLE